MGASPQLQSSAHVAEEIAFGQHIWNPPGCFPSWRHPRGASLSRSVDAQPSGESFQELERKAVLFSDPGLELGISSSSEITV